MSSLIKALKHRGFFVTGNDETINISNGNHCDDITLLLNLLKKLRVTASLDGQTITIEDEHISVNFNEVIWYPATNHEAGRNGGWRSWKYFIKTIYGPKIPTLSLEPGVALFVKALSAAGITTVSCCDGHGKKAPVISFYGRYNACWFLVLFEDTIKKEVLNYEWTLLMDKDSLDLDFIGKSKDNRWVLELVLEDTYKIANHFLVNSQYFSQIKREIYGANRRSNRKLVKEMSFHDLYDWMEAKYHNYLNKSK